MRPTVEALAEGTGADSAAHRLTAIDWNFPESADNGIHGIHPYPAKFISDIPRALIDCLGVQPGTALLDPFCGAGTTLVVAQEMGIPSIGIDLNPIACLISRIKTMPLPPELRATATRMAIRVGMKPWAPPSRQIPNLDHWFSTPAKSALASLVDEINAVADASLRDHLRLALSSIIVRVSNQESDTRYAAVAKAVTTRLVLDQFVLACSRLEATKRARMASATARVIESDILSVTPELVGTPVSLVVTSPPYPNAYEYWLYHKYRMWWLGYDPLAVRAQEIGARPHYFRKNHATFSGFRAQMGTVLRLLSAVLVDGGYACFIAGRSRIHGNDYDNAAMLSEEAGAVGLATVANIQRTIRAKRKSFNLSHARIKTEQVLVLQKVS
jgi:site-specific DNA-methyltransferase (cytosine-N4-specific)